ncbi:tyrosine protein kinase [Pelomyxa schiedti]|nr:tyrosine protein kinase [Pelomyxa schiedti]
MHSLPGTYDWPPPADLGGYVRYTRPTTCDNIVNCLYVTSNVNSPIVRDTAGVFGLRESWGTEVHPTMWPNIFGSQYYVFLIVAPQNWEWDELDPGVFLLLDPGSQYVTLTQIFPGNDAPSCDDLSTLTGAPLINKALVAFTCEDHLYIFNVSGSEPKLGTYMKLAVSNGTDVFLLLPSVSRGPATQASDIVFVVAPHWMSCVATNGTTWAEMVMFQPSNEVILSAAVVDFKSAVTCTVTTGGMFYIELHEAVGPMNWRHSTLHSWMDSSSSCAITVADIQTSVDGDDFIACQTEQNLVWLTRVSGESNWRNHSKQLSAYEQSITVILASSTLNTKNKYSLMVASNTTMQEYFLVQGTCSSWSDEYNCTMMMCNWCRDLGVCQASSCVSCAYISKENCTSNEGCLFCQETQSCESECVTCMEQTTEITCALYPDGCNWCNNVEMCLPLSQWCSECEDISADACSSSCMTCGDTCSMDNATCESCSEQLTEDACYEYNLFCNWCSSTQTCIPISSYCSSCSALDSTVCKEYVGCAIVNETCTSNCAKLSSEDSGYFFSTYLEHGLVGNVTDVDTDSSGNSYVVGYSDGPFVAKLDPSGEVICSKVFDTTGVASAVSVDMEAGLFYVVGAGKNVALIVDGAPTGLLYTTAPLTVDAVVIAYNMSDCSVSWSIRWGGMSNLERFTDILLIEGKYRILTATVPGDFPTQGCSSHSTQEHGLLLVFDWDTDWTLLFCTFTSDSYTASLTEVSAYSRFNILNIVAIGECYVNYNTQCLFMHVFQPDQSDFTSSSAIYGSQSYDKCSSVVIEDYDAYIVGYTYSSDFSSAQNPHDVTEYPVMFFSQVSLLWWTNGWLNISTWFLPSGSGTTITPYDVTVQGDFLFFVGQLQLSTLNTSSLGYLGYINITSHSIFNAWTVGDTSGSNALYTLHVDERIFAGGSTSSSIFFSTTTVLPNDSAQSMPIFMAISSEDRGLCIPSFPTAPITMVATPLYPTSTDADLQVSSVLWPSFTFSWVAARFGYACTEYNPNCTTYNVSIWNLPENYTTSTLSLSVFVDFPIASYSIYTWSISACRDSECVQYPLVDLEFNLESTTWQFDAADSALVKFWTCGECTLTAAVDDTETDPLHKASHVLLTTDEESFNATFTTNYTFISASGFSWIIFAIKSNGLQWESGPEIMVFDGNGGNKTWIPKSSYLPGTSNSWFELGVPLSDDLETLPLEWSIITSAGFDPNWIVKFFISGSLISRPAYIYTVEIDNVMCSDEFTFTDQLSSENAKSSSSESKGLKRRGIILLSTILPISFIVGCGLVLYLISRKKRRPEETVFKEDIFIQGTELKPMETFEAGTAKFVEIEEFPLSFSDPKLHFGYTTRQAPVAEQIENQITVTNNSESKYMFTFFPPRSAKITLQAEPNSAFLKPGEEIQVAVTAVIHCTARLNMLVTIALCPHSKWGAAEIYTKLPLVVESKLTSFLDPDEFTLFSPPVGEGSFGAVFRGEWRGQEVAIKMLKNQTFSEKNVIEDFKHEVEVMEALKSPYIVRFVGASHIPGKLAIVTEFLSLGSVRACALAHKFSVPFKIKCMLDCCRGMDYLHQCSILHRDLKPDNLLMCSLDITSDVVCKLIDFGTTRDINVSQATQYYTKGVGTPVFMAPELLDSGKYSQSADVYSFGVMMWSLMSDKEPYANQEAFATSWQIVNFVVSGKRLDIPPTVDKQISDIIESAWAQEPHARPSFSALVDTLDALLKELLCSKSSSRHSHKHKHTHDNGES